MGIKMSGMPAIGQSHSDEDIWSIAAFVRQLPTMTPEQYKAMEKRYPRGAADQGQEARQPQPLALTAMSVSAV